MVCYDTVLTCIVRYHKQVKLRTLLLLYAVTYNLLSWFLYACFTFGEGVYRKGTYGLLMWVT